MNYCLDPIQYDLQLMANDTVHGMLPNVVLSCKKQCYLAGPNQFEVFLTVHEQMMLLTKWSTKYFFELCLKLLCGSMGLVFMQMTQQLSLVSQ